MAESALSKLNKAAAEKAKSYKTSHDVERVHHLIAAAALMRDWPATAALAASFTRELAALSLQQADIDAENKAQTEKAHREATTSDADDKELAENPVPKSAPRRA